MQFYELDQYAWLSINIKYFANIRDIIGREGDEIEFTDGITVAGIWQKISGDLDENTSYLTAVNMEYSSEDTVVTDGDEIAFFPKVSGG